MTVRPATENDIGTLIEINKKHGFPFPELENILYMLVIEDKGEIVAWGYTKKYVEVVFVPDKTTPNITKVKSLKLINERSCELAKSLGVDQLHSYVEDEKFAKLLVERFDYGICTGIPLFLNINNNGKKR